MNNCLTLVVVCLQMYLGNNNNNSNNNNNNNNNNMLHPKYVIARMCLLTRSFLQYIYPILTSAFYSCIIYYLIFHYVVAICLQ